MALKLKRPKPAPKFPMIMTRCLGGPAVGIILTNPSGESIYIEPVWDGLPTDGFADGGDWSFHVRWGVDPHDVAAAKVEVFSMMLTGRD